MACRDEQQNNSNDLASHASSKSCQADGGADDAPAPVVTSHSGEDAAAPSALLGTMAKFSEFTTNIWGADKVYKIIMYTSRLLSMGLQRAQDSDKMQSADVRVQLAAFALQNLSSKVSSNISSARYILRFFGTVDWALRLASNPYSAQQQPLHAALHQISALCMLLFHPADHAVWLGKAAPDLVPQRSTNKAQLFGTRAANVFLLCQLLLKLLQLQSLSQHRRQLTKALARLQEAEQPTGSAWEAPAAAAEQGSPASQKRAADQPVCVDGSVNSTAFDMLTRTPPVPPSSTSALQAQQQAVRGVQAQIDSVDTQLAAVRFSLVRYALDWLVTLHYALPRGIGLSPAATSIMSLASTLIATKQQWTAMG